MNNINIDICEGGNFVSFHTGKGYWKQGLLVNGRLLSLTGYVKEPFTIKKMNGSRGCGRLLIKAIENQ